MCLHGRSSRTNIFLNIASDLILCRLVHKGEKMTDPLVFDGALDLMIVADLVLKLPLLLFDSAKIDPWLRWKLIRRLA